MLQAASQCIICAYGEHEHRCICRCWVVMLRLRVTLEELGDEMFTNKFSSTLYGFR